MGRSVHRGARGGLEVKVKGLDRLIFQNYTSSLFHAGVQPQMMALIRKEQKSSGFDLQTYWAEANAVVSSLPQRMY